MKTTRAIEAKYSRLIKNTLLATKKRLLIKLSKIKNIAKEEKKILYKKDSLDGLSFIFKVLKDIVLVNNSALKEIFKAVNLISQENEETLLEEHLPLNTEKIKLQEDLFIAKQKKYISDLNNKFLDNINNDILNNITENSSQKDIDFIINDRYKKAIKSADNISSDEILIATGVLAEERQRTLDVEIYQWQTMRDERVRLSHKNLQGKYCTWNNPDLYADTLEEARNGEWKTRTAEMEMLHPGRAYGCRCFALPII